MKSDFCIYCGSREPGRTREHVIPRALKGHVIIHTASCSSCQKTINSEIESFQLSVTLKAVREKLGYQSRRGNEVLSWPYTVKQSVPPFQRTVMVPIAEAPLITHFPRFLPPPLPGCEQMERQAASESKFETVWVPANSIERDRQWMAIRSKFISPGAFGQVSVQCAPFNWFVMVRFFAKIAIGFAASTDEQIVFRHHLGRMVLDPEDARSTWSENLFSVPRRQLPDLQQGSIIVGDGGRRYVAFEVLPEVNPEIYFALL